MEDIVKAEKEYLVNVLGKRLIDSDEYDKNYRRLAMMYWPEEFEKAKKEGYRLIVHHIDFDRANNVLSNLVVLTYSEHKTIHYMFDPDAKNTKELQSKVTSERNKAGNFGMKNKKHKSVTKERMKNSHLGLRWKQSDEAKKKRTEYNTGRIWVTNGSNNKFVLPIQATALVQSGYYYGMTHKKSA